MMQLNVIAFALHLISLMNKFTQNVNSLTEDQSGKAKKKKNENRAIIAATVFLLGDGILSFKTLCPSLLF